jgi:hypothetical protein
MYGAALRGLYLIDPKGKVRSMQINDDQAGKKPYLINFTSQERKENQSSLLLLNGIVFVMTC